MSGKDDAELDLKMITKALKKTYKCNGNVTIDPKDGEILQLQGDHRSNIQSFFIEEEICHASQIVLHGG